MAQPRNPATVLAGSMATDDYNRRAANNPFKNAKSLAALKKIYSSMTAKQRGKDDKTKRRFIADSFRRAAAKLQTTKAKPPETKPVSKAQPADKNPGGQAATSTPPTTVTKPIGKKNSPAAGRAGSAKPSNSSTPRGGGSRRIGGSRSRRNARYAKMSIKDIGKTANRVLNLTYPEGKRVRKGNNIYVVKNGRMVFDSRVGQNKFPGKK